MIKYYGDSFVLSNDVAISQICISFFHVLYLSLSNVGGEKYFEAIVSFSSATNVKYKELRLQHSVYGEMPFFISPHSLITSTSMAVASRPVLEKTPIFLESIRGGNLHDLTHHSFSF